MIIELKANAPVLTIGMPVYNEEKYIAEAIDSLLAQTYKNFVLIISDNASIDRTQQICEEYAKKDERIKYVRHKENKGAMFNFRYLVEQAKTPFFMWCGAHDKWDPTFIKKLLPAFDNRNVILSYPRSKEFNGDKSFDDIFNTMGVNKPIGRYLKFLQLLIRKGSYNFIYGIWKTEALKSCNLQLKTFAPDIDILLQGSLEGIFSQTNEALFYPRKVRKEETYKEMVKRQMSDLSETKINKSSFFLIILFMINAIKIPFYKDRTFGFIKKIWLSANTFLSLILIFLIKRQASEIKSFFINLIRREYNV